MRIVICDDHQLLLESLAAALAHRGVTVEAAALTPSEAVRAVALHDPDILLIDLTFPSGSGMDAAREVVDHHPRTKVVLFTAQTSPTPLMEALQLGVAGYICKDRPVREIVAELEAVAAGGSAVDRSLLRQVHRPTRRIAHRRAPRADLTQCERRVADLLVEGLNTDEIMRRLGVSQSTVRTHVQSILTKLGVHSRLQAVAVLSTQDTSGRVRVLAE